MAYFLSVIGHAAGFIDPLSCAYIACFIGKHGMAWVDGMVAENGTPKSIEILMFVFSKTKQML